MIFFAISGLHAQQQPAGYLLKGSLTDSISGQGLSFANVGLLNAADSSFAAGTTAESDGSFEFRKVKPGKYFLRISYVGYRQGWVPVIAEGSNDKIDLGKIGIQQQASTLDAVEISEKKPVYQYAADKKVYNVSEDVSIQSGTTSDALQNAPGVYVDLEGNITLRGVSGVAIWINGKPSKLTGDGLKTYLQQLPANALERIEVITNPSAKFSASGTGGIINIVTREKIKKNNFFSLGFNYSTQPFYTPWLSYLTSNDKIKFSSYANYSLSNYDGKGSSEGLITNGEDTLYSIASGTDWKSSYYWLYGHLSLEIQADKSNTVEFYAGGSLNGGQSKWTSNSTKHEFHPESIYNVDYRSQYSNSGFYYYAGSTYNHNFKSDGHFLNIDLYGFQQDATSQSHYSEVYSIPGMRNKFMKIRNNNDVWSVNFNARYENPINDSTTLEAGIEAEVGNTVNPNRTDTLDVASSEFIYCPFYTNRSAGMERELEGYLSFGSKIWGISYKVGLRAEYAFVHLNSFSMNEVVNREFFNIYPSVFLSYGFKNNHNISLSYSRRVEYPDYQLNPFVDYSNEENIWSGNPTLKAAFTNSFELGYSKYFKSGGSFSTSLYYRYTGRGITSVTNPVYDTILRRTTLYTTYINEGQNSFAGAEINLVLRPVKFLNLIFNGNGYYLDYKAEFPAYTISRSSFAWDTKLSATFSFLKTAQIQITGVYKSSTISLQGKNFPDYYINAFFKADFFKRILSVNIGVQDIFNWQNDQSEINVPGYSGSDEFKRVTRYLRAGITLRLGKIEMESQVKTGQGG